MKSHTPPFKLVDNVSLAASFVSAPYDVVAYFGVSFQFLVTGSAPTGSLKLQMSNVPSPGTAAGSADWVDVPTQTTAVNPVALTVPVTGFWLYDQMRPVKWYRVVYTFTSGTGNVTIWGAGVRLG